MLHVATLDINTSGIKISANRLIFNMFKKWYSQSANLTARQNDSSQSKLKTAFADFKYSLSIF
jgi:hypothetical protein